MRENGGYVKVEYVQGMTGSGNVQTRDSCISVWREASPSSRGWINVARGDGEVSQIGVRDGKSRGRRGGCVTGCYYSYHYYVYYCCWCCSWCCHFSILSWIHITIVAWITWLSPLPLYFFIITAPGIQGKNCLMNLYFIFKIGILWYHWLIIN